MYLAAASTMISCDAQTIWKTLMQTDDWPKWNTFVTEIKIQPPHQRLEAGSTQIIRITPDPSNPGQTESYTNVITMLRENEELVWEGSLLSNMIFKTEHWCRLETRGISSRDGGVVTQTRFSQGERFSGLLAPMVWLSGKLGVLEKGYEKMNDDLKKYVER